MKLQPRLWSFFSSNGDGKGVLAVTVYSSQASLSAMETVSHYDEGARHSLLVGRRTVGHLEKASQTDEREPPCFDATQTDRCVKQLLVQRDENFCKLHGELGMYPCGGETCVAIGAVEVLQQVAKSSQHTLWDMGQTNFDKGVDSSQKLFKNEVRPLVKGM